MTYSFMAFLAVFQSNGAKEGRWGEGNERLYALELLLRLKKISAPSRIQTRIRLFKTDDIVS